MHSLFPTISHLIARHHAWAGAALGAVALVESLALIGAFIPATALMVMTGGLIAAGVLEPASVIIWSVAGAILGNAASYALGRRLGPQALRHPALAAHRRMIARTRLFTRRHGPASIFFGRFFGPLRALVPLTAGVLQMPRRTFQVANALSAPVWVIVLLAPGYLAAKGLAQVEAGWEADPLTILLGLGLILLVAGAAGWRARKSRAAGRVTVAARPAEER